jgi:hypothetical protein
MRHPFRVISRCALGGLLALLAGCSIAPPKPWEKDILARPAMAMDGDALGQRFLQHVYTSKENSSGGDGVGGGGCGCN